ncbi:MAG: 23S rRNA (uracil(1939)-C(5))-methyltransferase RlmD [Gemmiger sp.]
MAKPPVQAAACPNCRKGCGGCPLLALPYGEQLARKQNRARQLLGRFAPVRPILAAEQPLHYRNKAIASFAPGPRGALTCGIYAAGTHKVLPYDDCLLQREVLNRTVDAVRRAAADCRYTPYDEDRGTGLLRHVVVRCSADEKQVLATVVTPSEVLPGSRNFAAAVRRRAPWLTSLTLNVNSRRTSAVLGREGRVLYGPGHITDTLCGLEFSLSPGSFYQVNPAQTEVLYRQVLTAAGLTGRETVLDAYCGTGTIGLCAAAKAGQVVGVELSAGAVRDAAANARRNRIANARFVCADATPWMIQAAAGGFAPDVVLLDPPRAGSTPECIDAVAAMAPRRVVYVSCCPETLARDAAQFARRGYRARWFQPVDMFPQSEHLETVSLFLKN